MRLEFSLLDGEVVFRQRVHPRAASLGLGPTARRGRHPAHRGHGRSGTRRVRIVPRHAGRPAGRETRSTALPSGTPAAATCGSATSRYSGRRPPRRSRGSPRRRSTTDSRRSARRSIGCTTKSPARASCHCWRPRSSCSLCRWPCTPSGPRVLPLLQLKEFDQYTTTHSMNVAVLAMALAETLELGSAQVRAVGVAGLLHDLGKVRVPGGAAQARQADRRGAGRDSAPSRGGRAHSARRRSAARSGRDGRLRAPPDDRRNRLSCRHAPRDTHYGSRLVHVCDVYDALRTRRPYRDAWESEEALQYIEQRAGLEFDPSLAAPSPPWFAAGTTASWRRPNSPRSSASSRPLDAGRPRSNRRPFAAIRRAATDRLRHRLSPGGRGECEARGFARFSAERWQRALPPIEPAPPSFPSAASLPRHLRPGLLDSRLQMSTLRPPVVSASFGGESSLHALPSLGSRGVMLLPSYDAWTSPAARMLSTRLGYGLPARFAAALALALPFEVSLVFRVRLGAGFFHGGRFAAAFALDDRPFFLDDLAAFGITQNATQLRLDSVSRLTGAPACRRVAAAQQAPHSRGQGFR